MNNDTGEHAIRPFFSFSFLCYPFHIKFLVYTNVQKFTVWLCSYVGRGRDFGYTTIFIELSAVWFTNFTYYLMSACVIDRMASDYLYILHINITIIGDFYCDKANEYVAVRP